MDQRPHAKSRGLTEGPRLCLKGTLFHLARASKKRLELGVQGNSGAGAAAFPGRQAQRQLRRVEWVEPEKQSLLSYPGRLWTLDGGWSRPRNLQAARWAQFLQNAPDLW